MHFQSQERRSLFSASLQVIKLQCKYSGKQSVVVVGFKYFQRSKNTFGNTSSPIFDAYASNLFITRGNVERCDFVQLHFQIHDFSNCYIHVTFYIICCSRDSRPV